MRLEEEATKKARYEKSQRPYYETWAFAHGPFVMIIQDWSVSLDAQGKMGMGSVAQVGVDPAAVQRIEAVVKTVKVPGPLGF